MPLFELTLILRPMPKAEIVSCLKRTAGHIWNEGGVLQRMEYLGVQKLPYVVKSSDGEKKYHEGHYFLYHCSLKQSTIVNIRPELKLDMDIIKSKIHPQSDTTELENYECTLSEELLPPAFRKSVQPLLEEKNVRADVRR